MKEWKGGNLPKLHFFVFKNIALLLYSYDLFLLYTWWHYRIYYFIFRWKYTGAFPLQPHLWDHWDLCPPSRGHHGGKYDLQLGLDLFVPNYCPKPAMKRLLYLKWVRADLKLLEIWNLCWLIKPKIVFIWMFIVQDPSQPIQVRNLKN